mgnify:CR=1 FL=1
MMSTTENANIFGCHIEKTVKFYNGFCSHYAEKSIPRS